MLSWPPASKSFFCLFQGYSQMELEEIGAVKLPKLLQAKILPVVNIKLEVNMGVISPFNEQFIG